MADKITESTILAIGVEYTDETSGNKKTSYIKTPNPKSGITETQIKTAMQNYLTNNIFVNDDLSPLTDASVSTAYKETTRRTEYDIGYFD